MTTEHKRRAAAPAPAEPILTIEDVAPRREFCRINGTTYDFIIIDSLGLRGRAQVNHTLARIDELEKTVEPSEDDEREYRDRMGEAVALLLPSCPAEVVAKLTDAQKANVVFSFFARVVAMSERVTLLRSLSPTSEPSSPGSSASTAATRRRGS